MLQRMVAHRGLQSAATVLLLPQALCSCASLSPPAGHKPGTASSALGTRLTHLEGNCGATRSKVAYTTPANSATRAGFSVRPLVAASSI